MRKLFVAIPCYSGELCIQTMHSLLFSIEEAKADGWDISADCIHSRVSDADIGMARNAFLGMFLRSDCTDLLYVDADICWGKGVLNRLLSHSAEFVAGAYRAKRDDTEKYTILWPEKKNMIVDEKSGFPLVEIDGCGFGFVKLTRAGVQKLFDETEHKFIDPIQPEVECPWVFEFAHEGGQRFSEDYIFCKRWKERVGPIWLDPSVAIDHVGKKIYQGDICNYLRKETLEHQMAEIKELQSDAA